SGSPATGDESGSGPWSPRSGPSVRGRASRVSPGGPPHFGRLWTSSVRELLAVPVRDVPELAVPTVEGVVTLEVVLERRHRGTPHEGDHSTVADDDVGELVHDLRTAIEIGRPGQLRVEGVEVLVRVPEQVGAGVVVEGTGDVIRRVLHEVRVAVGQRH